MPLLSIADHPIPYNGTTFTLTAIAQLHPSVDTNVTFEGMWSGDDSPQVTISPPHQATVEFQPLTPDSSKDYVLNVTFRSSSESPFITGNGDSLVYSLVVQCEWNSV